MEVVFKSFPHLNRPPETFLDTPSMHNDLQRQDAMFEGVHFGDGLTSRGFGASGFLGIAPVGVDSFLRHSLVMVWVMFWFWLGNILAAASATGQPGRMAEVLGSHRFGYALFVEARSAWHGSFSNSCREITTAGRKRVGSVKGGSPPL